MWPTPDAPTPPNPLVTAAASTSTNVATGVANAFLNNVNQNTPQGNLSYDVSGTYSWKDPVTGQDYSIPRFTATQTPAWWTQQPGPSGNSLENNQMASQYNLSETARQRSWDLMNASRTNFDPTQNAPVAGNAWWLKEIPFAADTFGDAGAQQFGFADTGQQRTGFDPVFDLQRSYGPQDNFSADRGRVEEALYGRINPQLEQDRSRLEQRLADQGIRYGSQAYDDAMRQLNQQQTDARLAVTAAGGAEQQRMNEMARAQGTFFNTAQNQAFQQARERGAFANEAQAQQYLQAMQRGQFYNQAQTNTYQQLANRAEFTNAARAQQLSQQNAWLNAQNAQRNQYLNEQFQLRNQPLNELTALMSGSQVQQPSWVTSPQNSIATTDVAGLMNNRFNQDLGIYQQQSANMNALIGGIFGAAGSIGKGFAMSDRRVKEDIEKVGSVFAAGPDAKQQLPIYEFAYKDDPSSTRHVGPMAQDVEKIDKRAVQTFNGVKHINMTRLGSILKAA